MTMKSGLLEYLECPETGQDLTLEVFYEVEEIINGKKFNEIYEGLLKTKDGKFVYPIINGIPRLLPISLHGELRKYHKEFFRKHWKYFSTIKDSKNSDVIDGSKRTLRSYSYQWRTFDEMLKEWKRYFDDYMKPFKPSFFKGKKVLDVGCGYGRIAHYAAKYSAEVFAMDLSEAVESAYKNTREFSNCHIVQGSIYNIPFKKKFDLIYSVGVIQHTPKKEESFRKLVEKMKKGTLLYIWVYSKRNGIYNLIYPMRKITTKMPFRLLKVVCFGCAVLQSILILFPYKLMVLFGVKSLKKLAKKIPYTTYAYYPFRYNYADWFDRLSVPLTDGFSREQVESWFKKADLEDITIMPRVTGWRGIGRK